MRHHLFVNHKKCLGLDKCGKCEKILPTFRSKYNGSLMISNNRSDVEEIKAACHMVAKQCPVRAICFCTCV
jgi:hypothetical protein